MIKASPYKCFSAEFLDANLAYLAIEMAIERLLGDFSDVADSLESPADASGQPISLDT